ncbi:3762_t:CDS:2, partial [Entrophospora sp. SA101]
MSAMSITSTLEISDEISSGTSQIQEASVENITEDETDLYDRQIRLWGLEAQQKMRNSSILICGMRGLSNEVCKNIVLSGVGKVTIIDQNLVTENDLGAQFLLSEQDIGKNRALAAADRVKYLNPRVNVTTDTDDIRNKPKDYFQKFDLITLTDCDTNTIIEINRICHELGKKFYAASTYGIYGYIFCDLLQHEFIEERRVAIPHKDEVEIKMIKKNAKYENFETFLSNDWATTKRKKIKPLFWAIQTNNHPPKLSEDIEKLSSIRDSYMQSVGIDSSFVSDELLKSLVLNFSAELSPICAIVGGILAQDILKALSCKELPINNFFIYDGNEEFNNSEFSVLCCGSIVAHENGHYGCDKNRGGSRGCDRSR